MKVLIKEEEYEFVSDHPNGWNFSAGNDYKSPVEISSYKCFIKRYSHPENISGWQLLVNLKGRPQPNLTKIYDVVSTNEQGKIIYYVFYQFIEGDTLNKLLTKNIKIDLALLTEDLLSALQSLHNQNFWFVDFTEKNIFRNKRGRFLLTGLDSAELVLKVPDINMYGDKDYWSLVFDFYKNILDKQKIKLSDINGIALNYLQTIFLILRIKFFQLDNDRDYHSDYLFHRLPSYLDKTSHAFRDVFEKLFRNKGSSLQWDLIIEIENLIKEKIIFNPQIDAISNKEIGLSSNQIVNDSGSNDMIKSRDESFETKLSAKGRTNLSTAKEHRIAERKKDKIFFSYSRTDFDFAFKLANDLREAGQNVWIDEIDISFGEPWDMEIQKALQNAERVLVILSDTSVQSDNVLNEIHYALDKRKKIIPVIINNCELPFRLSRLHYIDFTKDYDKSLDRLLNFLNS